MGCLRPRCTAPATGRHRCPAQRATLQGEQLASIFPDLATRPSPGQPTRMEWAFACVRSRAFR